MTTLNKVDIEESAPAESKRLSLLVGVNGRTFAFPVDIVREIIQCPEHSAIPGCPSYVRGVVNIRDRVMTLVDLRQRLGYTSALAERQHIISELNQRELEHKNWIQELEDSLREGRPFTLATDPHACAFGRWYDNYESPNSMIAYHLKSFDAPHKSIHGLAKRSQEALKSGGKAAALELVERSRGTVLSRMLALFQELYVLIEQSAREIAVVMEVEDHLFAVVVDGVDALEQLADPTQNPAGQETQKPPLFKKLCFRDQADEIVPLLDINLLSMELRGLSLQN